MAEKKVVLSVFYLAVSMAVTWAKTTAGMWAEEMDVLMADAMEPYWVAKMACLGAVLSVGSMVVTKVEMKVADWTML